MTLAIAHRHGDGRGIADAMCTAVLAVLNSGRVELLDRPRLVAQLCGLDRRTARSGDSIDHAPEARDDIANAVYGVAQIAVGGPPPLIITPEILAACERCPRSDGLSSAGVVPCFTDDQ